MGFSRKIKEQILVDCARHCCVCHRYKGVKVEVHHIKQKSLGGADTYRNAIALCFDCHADAGHYNSNHPKGTKFSPSELRKAKKAWIKIVKNNNITEPSQIDNLLCRYYLCENFELLVEIANKNLTGFPIDSPIMVNNNILTALRNIISRHPETYREANAWGESYSNSEDYLAEHPDAIITDKSSGEFSYFNFIRTPSINELEKLRTKDCVLDLMLEEGLPIKEITSIVGCFEHACWGVELQEEYFFRDIWGVFLTITNISERPLYLDSLTGNNKTDKGFSEFTVCDEDIDCINLPKAPIETNSTVVIPLAIIFPPLNAPKREIFSSVEYGGWEEQIESVTHESINIDDLADCLTYGGQIIANGINYKKDKNNFTQEIHPFDLTNLYSIDRSWSCGSCPHLFYQTDIISYVRELLAHCQFTIGEDSFIIPDNVSSIIIAEIEDETTIINSISVDKKIFANNIVLQKSEFIRIPVSPGSIVNVKGKYIPERKQSKQIPQGKMRNKLIAKYLYDNSISKK